MSTKTEYYRAQCQCQCYLCINWNVKTMKWNMSYVIKVWSINRIILISLLNPSLVITAPWLGVTQLSSVAARLSQESTLLEFWLFIDLSISKYKMSIQLESEWKFYGITIKTSFFNAVLPKLPTPLHCLVSSSEKRLVRAVYCERLLHCFSSASRHIPRQTPAQAYPVFWPL